MEDYAHCISERGWILHDPLLINMLVSSGPAGGLGSKGICHWQASNSGPVYLLFYYYAVRELNVVRIPGYEDERMCDLVGKYQFREENLFDSISDDEINSAFGELAALHSFTTRKIVERTGSERVKLVRRVGAEYSRRIWAKRMNAMGNGQRDVQVEFSAHTVNSFSGPNLDGDVERSIENVGGYWQCDLQFVMEVAARDVIACSSSVAGAQGVGWPCDRMESEEWIVMNRDPRGLLRVPAENISKIGDWNDSESAPYRRRGGEFENRRVILPFTPDLTRDAKQTGKLLKGLEDQLPWLCQRSFRKCVRKFLAQTRGGFPL